MVLCFSAFNWSNNTSSILKFLIAWKLCHTSYSSFCFCFPEITILCTCCLVCKVLIYLYSKRIKSCVIPESWIYIGLYFVETLNLILCFFLVWSLLRCPFILLHLKYSVNILLMLLPSFVDFRDCLLIDPKEHPMLLAEPSSNSQQQREK